MKRAIQLHAVLALILFVSLLPGGVSVNAQEDSMAANKALVERHINEIFNGAQFDHAPEIYSDDFLVYSPLSPDPLDRDGFMATLEGFHAVFPDLGYAAYTMLAQDDLVAVQYTLSGTFTNEFNGIPPNGELVKIFGIDVWRIADGKIVECYIMYDTMGMLQQMGAAPVEGELVIGDPWAVTVGTTSDTPDEIRDALIANAASVEGEGFYDTIDTAWAEDCVLHDISRPEVVTFSGRDGMKQWISLFYGATPDFRHLLEDAHVVVEGDVGVIQMGSAGTFTGDFMGIPGNGNPITLPVIMMWRVKDGQVVEGWVNIDTLGLITQLTAEPLQAE